MMKLYAKDSSTELPKPVYAAAGAGELAYQQLRRLPEVAARTIRTAGTTAEELRQRLASREDPMSIRVRRSAERGRSAMRSTAAAAQERARTGYHNLVARGERVIAERVERGVAQEVEQGGPTKVEVVVGSPVAEQPATAEPAQAPSSPEPGAQPSAGPRAESAGGTTGAAGKRGGNRRAAS